MDDLEEKEKVLQAEPESRPSWQVRVEYSNHTVQDIFSCNDYLPERPKELYFSLLDYFDLKEEDFL